MFYFVKSLVLPVRAVLLACCAGDGELAFCVTRRHRRQIHPGLDTRRQVSAAPLGRMSASGTLLHGTRSEDGAGSLLAQSTSSKRFPDGARYRVEIPSVEGFRALAAVLEEAEARCVPVRRISQGRGVMLLTGREIREMAKQGQAGLI